MKKLKYSLVMALLGLFVACTEPKKEKTYIFLYDSINDTIIKGFKAILSPLMEKQPDGYKNITITVYAAHFNFDQRPVSVTFSTDPDTDTRKNSGIQFINQLQSAAAQHFSTRNILQLLDQIYSGVTDTSAAYTITVVSQMMENSGAALSSSQNPQSWRMGEFHFINGRGECNTAEFKEVNRQLRTPGCWINDHLVKMPMNNPSLTKCHLQTFIYQQPVLVIKTDSTGYDNYDIKRFWNSTLDSMHVRAQWRNEEFRFENYINGDINPGI